jgi:hypothetical protein
MEENTIKTVLRSTELSATDWEDITNGFNESFERNKKPEEQKKYYTSNLFGFAYHAVARNEEGRICAHTSVIPIYYLVKGEKVVFGQSGGSFVRKKYRQDAFLFLSLSDMLKAYCAKEGLKVTYGVSNKKSFRYAIKILKCAFIKDLDYFILPVSLSKLLKKKSLAFIDFFWYFLVMIWVLINKGIALLYVAKEKDWLIKPLVDDDFIRYRFDGKYETYKSKNNLGIYRVIDEEGIKTAYIMEFRHKGKRTSLALANLIWHIIRTQKPDAILFIGDLQMNQFLLYKVPPGKIPQRFPLTLDYLDEANKEMGDIVLSPESWDFSLVNFDVR